MAVSTRDMTRIGLLMLRGGKWLDKQIQPENWARYITSLVTPFHEMNPPTFRLRGRPERWGYGMMWWVWDAAIWPGGVSASPFQGAYCARGAGGQHILVLPVLDLVITHTVNIDTSPAQAVSDDELMAITHMVIASRCPGHCDESTGT